MKTDNTITLKETIRQLTEIAATLKGKDKASVLLKVAQLLTKLPPERQNDESLVVFHLPLRCCDCPFYPKHPNKF